VIYILDYNRFYKTCSIEFLMVNGIQGGFYVTFDGPEGCGKSTQVDLLNRRLILEGYEVVSTKEPGGTIIADKIRSVVLERGEEDIGPLTELFLFEAARNHLRLQVIIPSLNDGKIVLSDRSGHSSMAYQGYAGNVDVRIVSRLNEIATEGIVPNLEFFLDRDVSEGLVAEVDQGRFNDKTVEYHEKVRQGFLEIARQEPQRRVVVNYRQGDVEGMQEEIYKVTKEKIGSMVVAKG